MAVTMHQPSQCEPERFLEITITSPILIISKLFSYFLAQNAAIVAGNVTGIHINLQVLGVGDGLTVCEIFVAPVVLLPLMSIAGSFDTISWIFKLCSV
jgi:hypothetical protein